MAPIFRQISVNILTLYLTILLFSLRNAVTAVPEQELESMLAVLRARGHTLFGNAITTSGINYEIVSGDSFTFFAPIDSALFALDMTATAPDYVTTLRYHVVPRRLSLADLGRFPSGSSLSTLAESLEIRVDRRRFLLYDAITVDGVEIVAPGLFYSQDVAVHGLGGILSLRSRNASPQAPPVNSTCNNTYHQRDNKSGNHTSRFPNAGHHLRKPPPPPNGTDGIGNPLVGSPVPEPASFNEFSPTTSSEPPSTGGIDNRSGESPVPEPASFNGFSPANGFEPPSTDEVVSPTAETPVPEPASDNGFSPANSPGIGSSPSGYPPDLSPRNESPESSVFVDDYTAFSPPLISETQVDVDGGSKSMDTELISPDINQISLVGVFDKKPIEKIGVSGNIPAVIREEVLPGPPDTTPEKFWPLDEMTVDCPLTGHEIPEDHVSMRPGYLYTRQHFAVSTITCAQT